MSEKSYPGFGSESLEDYPGLNLLEAQQRMKAEAVASLQRALAEAAADVVRLSAENQRLRQQLAESEASGFAMAANQCQHPGGIVGDESGYSHCPLKANAQPIELTGEQLYQQYRSILGHNPDSWAKMTVHWQSVWERLASRLLLKP